MIDFDLSEAFEVIKHAFDNNEMEIVKIQNEYMLRYVFTIPTYKIVLPNEEDQKSPEIN